MKVNKQKLAQDILGYVGGEENVRSLIHCVTRLRFVLKDQSLAKDTKIKNLDGVISVVKSGGQYQVVIGNQVTSVFDEIMSLSTIGSEDTQAGSASTKERVNLFNRFIMMIVGIVGPIIGAIATAGILKGLIALLTSLNLLSTKSATYTLLYALADAMFYFLPILVGFSAAKRFKSNEYVGAGLGAALVYPTIVSTYTAGKALSLFGIPVVLANYTSSLFPVIMAVFIASLFEHYLTKRLPEALKMVFTPLISFTGAGLLTFLIIGPALTYLSDGLSALTMGIYHLSPIIAGLLLGAFWQLIVVLGLHYAFIPVLINNIATLHYDPVNAILSVTVFAQAGAALGVYFKSRDKKVRSVSGAAAVSALLGITEPAIYGVSIPYRKPFIMSMIAGGVGGVITAAMGAKMYSFGANGIFAAPLFINPKGVDISFWAYLISSATALLGTAILTYLFGFRDTKKLKVPESASKKKVEKGLLLNHKEIANPLSGELIPLHTVKDEVFSSGSMGEGYGIIPDDNNIYAPFDGSVVTVFETRHAIGLVSTEGVEMLIHMGLDTVELKGEPYDVKVNSGDTIKKGQLLAMANWDLIKSKGYDPTTPIIITNTLEYQQVNVNLNQQGKQLEHGTTAIVID